MLIDSELRRRVRDAQRNLETLSQRAAEFAAACGMGSETFSPLRSLAAAGGFVSVLAFGAARVKQRIAQDPPRPDYTSRTQARRIRGNPERLLLALREEDVPLDDRAQQLIAFGAALERDDAYEAAMLRAFERAGGAVREDAPEAASARLDEVFTMRERADSSLRSTVEIARQLPTAIEQIELDPNQRGAFGTSGSLEWLLPDEVLAALYRAGVPISKIRRIRVRLVRPTIRSEFARALASTGEELAGYAGVLGRWDAQRDLLALTETQTAVAARPAQATFEIYTDDEMRYRWRLRDSEGRVVVHSTESYATREEAHAVAELIMRIAHDARLAD